MSNLNDKNHPFVSIITPVYNLETYLEATVESVLKQTFSNWELILIDDCSSDSSGQLMVKLAKLDSRIKPIFLEKNSGAGVARNEGIKSAKGRYIAFLDGDDIWFSSKLEVQINYMQESGYHFVYSNYNVFKDSLDNKTGKIISPARVDYKSQIVSNMIGTSTVIFNCEALGKHYMPIIRLRQDWGLWLGLLKEVPYAYNVGVTLGSYRHRSDSLSSNKIKMITKNWKFYKEIVGLNTFQNIYYTCYNTLQKSYLTLARKFFL